MIFAKTTQPRKAVSRMAERDRLKKLLNEAEKALKDMRKEDEGK